MARPPFWDQRNPRGGPHESLGSSQGSTSRTGSSTATRCRILECCYAFICEFPIRRSFFQGQGQANLQPGVQVIVDRLSTMPSRQKRTAQPYVEGRGTVPTGARFAKKAKLQSWIG